MNACVIDTQTPGEIELYRNLARMGAYSIEEMEARIVGAQYTAARNAAVFEKYDIDYTFERRTPDNLGIAAARFTYLAMADEGSIEGILTREDVTQIGTRPAEDAEIETADPIVLKRTSVQRGVDKYLLETEQQRAVASEFLGTLSEEKRRKWRVQDYFEGAQANKAISIRVITSPVGNILGASAVARSLGSKFHDGILREQGDGWSALADPASKFFLSSRDIRSNIDAGGTALPIAVNGELPSGHKLSRSERRMLRKAGIDDELPASVVDHAVDASKKAGAHVGIFLGLDYIATEHGTFGLLEMNPHPGLETFKKWQRLKPGMNDNDVLDKLLEKCAEGIRDYYQ